MEEQKQNGQMTPLQLLAILNQHIDDNIKSSCGAEKLEEKWGLGEINNILNCVAGIKNALDELERLKDIMQKAKDMQETRLEAKKDEVKPTPKVTKPKELIKK